MGRRVQVGEEAVYHFQISDTGGATGTEAKRAAAAILDFLESVCFLHMQLGCNIQFTSTNYKPRMLLRGSSSSSSKQRSFFFYPNGVLSGQTTRTSS